MADEIKLTLSPFGSADGEIQAAAEEATQAATQALAEAEAQASKKVAADTLQMQNFSESEQKMIDDIGTDLGLTKQQVYDAFADNPMDTGVLNPKYGEPDEPEYTVEPRPVTTTWDWTVSTLPGTVTPAHVHTPGDPQQENVVPATCTAAGS